MSVTKRHHYIPEFFIKDYVGDDKMVSVYNKITGKLDNLIKSPKQVFFEWNRNTFKINQKIMISLKNSTNSEKQNFLKLTKR
jgi:hypothetical protein